MLIALGTEKYLTNGDSSLAKRGGANRKIHK